VRPGGPRGKAPLVLVDATSAREHDPARWTNPASSPLALADRGMLVLLDGAALPAEVQRLLATALAERRAPWERPGPLDVQLALTGVAPPDGLVEAGRLDPSLAARLGDASASPVTLPRLRDRPEDLRAVLTDRLAREGLRVLGRPVGIDHGAYALLARHAFPGDDAELSALVQRLVGFVAEGFADVVRADDVRRLNLEGPEHQVPTGDRRKDPLSA
jgi:DNA-binding NtrC family response regulator